MSYKLSMFIYKQMEGNETVKGKRLIVLATVIFLILVTYSLGGYHLKAIHTVPGSVNMIQSLNIGKSGLALGNHMKI